MKREILTYPNPILREKSEPVGENEDIRQLVDDMLETMYAAGGIGLAAIQVGVRKCVFVMDAGGRPLVLVNPVILELQGARRFMREGCLSVPNVFETIMRNEAVLVEYTVPGGIRITTTHTGLEAHCVQHESEHLLGMLFPDHLPDFKKERVFAKFLKRKP